MAFVACRAKGSSGGSGGTRRWIFNDEFVNGYESVQVNQRSGTYYDTVYWGMDGRYDGKPYSYWAYKTAPLFGNTQYKYLKFHVAKCWAVQGQSWVGIFDSNGNSLYTSRLCYSTSQSSSGFNDRWFTVDMSEFPLQTESLYFAFSGQCGYDSGQWWQIWIDKIYLTNEED